MQTTAVSPLIVRARPGLQTTAVSPLIYLSLGPLDKVVNRPLPCLDHTDDAAAAPLNFVCLSACFYSERRRLCVLHVQKNLHAGPASCDPQGCYARTTSTSVHCGVKHARRFGVPGRKTAVRPKHFQQIGRTAAFRPGTTTSPCKLDATNKCTDVRKLEQLCTTSLSSHVQAAWRSILGYDVTTVAREMRTTQPLNCTE